MTTKIGQRLTAAIRDNKVTREEAEPLVQAVLGLEEARSIQGLRALPGEGQRRGAILVREPPGLLEAHAQDADGSALEHERDGEDRARPAEAVRRGVEIGVAIAVLVLARDAQRAGKEDIVFLQRLAHR